MTDNKYQLIGSISLFVSVALGAFGAHSLKGTLTPYHLEIFETAVRYQMIHSLPLLFLPSNNLLNRAKIAFIFGILFFSGSLYLLAVTGIKVLGAITPIGGLLFLFSWATLSYFYYTKKD